MPKLNRHQYEDNWDEDEDFVIENDEPRNRRGDRLPPPKPSREDLEWEENRKRFQQRRSRERD